ncbi:MAG TPA: MarR family transcriptional regulator [Tepidisphaeraceae bacterium]
MPHLTPTMTRFILHWGEMGTRWGINRTVAQVHALLFISQKPLHAEEIAETLSVARSNVSTSLRELQSWGIVRVVHVMGDRRDHFESIKDVWELYRQVMDERKRREIDPTLSVLRECVMEAEKSGPEDKYARERIGELLGFFETMTAWYEQLKRLPTASLLKMARLGEKIRKLLG